MMDFRNIAGSISCYIFWMYVHCTSTCALKQSTQCWQGLDVDYEIGSLFRCLWSYAKVVYTSLSFDHFICKKSEIQNLDYPAKLPSFAPRAFAFISNCSDHQNDGYELWCFSISILPLLNWCHVISWSFIKLRQEESGAMTEHITCVSEQPVTSTDRIIVVTKISTDIVAISFGTNGNPVPASWPHLPSCH